MRNHKNKSRTEGDGVLANQQKFICNCSVLSTGITTLDVVLEGF